MNHTSLKTYERAFTADEGIKNAAGNYENKVLTKIAKAFIGVITLGIGYGVIRLIEERVVTRPKISEFCDNAKLIYRALVENEGAKCRVVMTNGEAIILSEEHDTNGNATVKIKNDNGDSTTLPGKSFASIIANLEKDSEDNFGYYGEILGKEKNSDEIFERVKQANEYISENKQDNGPFPNNESFLGGGVYKKFCRGYLRALDDRDFNKESLIRRNFEHVNGAERYISLQRKVDSPHKNKADYKYAVVDMYNNNVGIKELDLYIKDTQ